MTQAPKEDGTDGTALPGWMARIRALTHWTDDHDPYPYIKLFRIGFYLIMVWEWYTLHHGPMSPWERAFAYTDWRAWGAAISPTSQLGADLILWVGIASALAAITNRKAKVHLLVHETSGGMSPYCARRLRRLAQDAEENGHDTTDYTLSSTASAFVPYYSQRICTAIRMHGAQGILKGIRRARRDLLRTAPAATA